MGRFSVDSLFEMGFQVLFPQYRKVPTKHQGSELRGPRPGRGTRW